MMPLTREWVDKAEEDFRSLDLLSSAGDPPFNVMCFLAQQAAEKYLKAVLQHRNLRFPRVHDLVQIVALVVPPDQRLQQMVDELKSLTEFAVDVRYPGFFADQGQASEAADVARRIRIICRELLDLDGNA